MKNRNLQTVIFIISIIALALFITLFVLDTLTYANYVKTEARIISVETRFGSSNTTNMNRSYYVTYEYTVNGETVTMERQEFFQAGKAEGDIKTVKYNPASPYALQNTYSYYAKIGVIVFLGIFSSLLCVVIIRKKRF